MYHQYIRAYDVAPDGSVSNSRLFANMHSAEDGVPDGMKVDTDGRVYYTGAGGVGSSSRTVPWLG